MKRRRALLAIATFLLSSTALGASTLTRGNFAAEPIRYEISVAHPESHLFHITMKVPAVESELTVQMPAWNALYQIRDFSSHIQQVEAHVGEEAVPIEKIDKQTWTIRATGTVCIDYSIYWDDAGPFASQLNREHAFINAAMLLMYVPARRSGKTILVVEDLPDNWHVASSLKFDCEAAASTGHCTSAETTYDEMVDAPVEVGKFKEFSIPGVPVDIRAVVHGEDWSQGTIESELSRICNYELKLMGGAPFDHYVFILHIGRGAGGGGMEHSYSTAIGVPSGDFLSGVAAHEFFHLWNVKRIRPATLEPVDFTKEQYTRALWFAEGVTSTYGSYTLVRSGLWNKDRFYADLGEQISELESRPAHLWQSAEQSSLDAWLEKYPMYNGPDDSVSYYNKGQLLGDLLDIVIRDRTSNQKSLDDVLRAMNTDFAKQGKTYRDSLDIRLEAEKIAGGSFEEFFKDYVAGVKPLPYQGILALAGLALQTSEESRPTLGFTAQRDAAGNISVRAVDPGSPAEAAGLQVGDVLVSWNGGDVPRSSRRWLQGHQPGETVKMRVRRDEKELNIELKLGEEKEVIYQVSEDPHANDKARMIREGLLHGVTQGAPATH